MPPRPMRDSAAKCWTLTLNNPPAGYQLKDDHPELVKYLSYQLEIGESGTPHLQGYVEFIAKQRRGAIKKLSAEWSKMHLEVARDPAAARHYTVKPCADLHCPAAGCQEERLHPTAVAGSNVEVGSPAVNGVSSEYAAAVKLITDGGSLKDVATAYPKEYVRHHAGFSVLLSTLHTLTPQELPLQRHALYPWQTELIAILQERISDRKIHWIYDRLGNVGKTWLRNMLYIDWKAFVVTTTKKDDVLYQLQSHQWTAQPHVAILNIERSEGMKEAVNIAVLEMLKDLVGSCGKYHSKAICWNPMHVVVLSNFAPSWKQYDSLSHDRWIIWEVIAGDGDLPILQRDSAPQKPEVQVGEKRKQSESAEGDEMSQSKEPHVYSAFVSSQA